MSKKYNAVANAEQSVSSTFVKGAAILTVSMIIVKVFGLLDKVIFSSFDYRTIDALKDISLDLPCGLLYDPLQAECYDRRVLLGQFLRVLDLHRADALHPLYPLAMLPPNFIRICHDACVKVNVWGIRESQGRVLAEFKRTDVDGIITDII